MRKISSLILASLTVCALPAVAELSDAAKPAEIKLQPEIPGERDRRVQTPIDLTPVAPAALPPAALPDAFPGVPRIASDAAPAGVALSAPAPVPGDPPLTKNFVPGQPVPTYPTLAAAAAAGVDPLPELSLEGAALTSEESAANVRFDWANLSSYLTWFQANPSQALLYGGSALAALLLGAWALIRNGRSRG